MHNMQHLHYIDIDQVNEWDNALKWYDLIAYVWADLIQGHVICKACIEIFLHCEYYGVDNNISTAGP